MPWSCPGEPSQPRKQLDAWQEWAKQRGARGLAYVLVQEDGELGGPVAKNLSDEEKAGLAEHVGAKPGDCVFFAAGPVKSSRALLGAARLEIGRRCGLIDEDAWSSSGSSTPRCSSPSTRPRRPVTSRSAAAPGPRCTTRSPRRSRSPRHVRHRPRAARWPTPTTSSATATRSVAARSVSTARTSRSGCSPSWACPRPRRRRSSASCSQAFKYGAPPHGGIAFGWDRICALLAGTDSIRDVIAFPKTGAGYDPLTAAPAPITSEQRKEAGVDARPDAAAKPAD